MLGMIEGKRRRGPRRVRWPESIIDSMDMSLSELCEIVKDRGHGALQSMGTERVGHDSGTEQ